jgi:chromosome segregation ATPase
MNINMSMKNIIILVLFALVIFFGYKSFFDIDDSYKDEIELLKEDNRKLIKKRDSLNKNIRTLEEDLVDIKSRDSILLLDIDKTRDSIDNAKNIADRTKKELDSIRTKISKGRNKIDSLIDNPPNKSDSLLLQSLKIKLNDVK